MDRPRRRVIASDEDDDDVTTSKEDGIPDVDVLVALDGDDGDDGEVEDDDDVSEDSDGSDGCRRGRESLSDSETVRRTFSPSVGLRGRFPSAGGGADSFPSRDCTRFGPIIG